MSSQEKTQTHREGNVKTEAETGVIWPQVKECMKPSEAGKGGKWILPLRFPGGSTALPSFGLPASGTVR